MRPHLTRHEVAIPGLDPRHDGVRVVHITDVHCGRMTPASHVQRAVDLANAVEPDVVVMTGDYVSWHRGEVRAMERQLSGLRAKHVFATLGNHDYFASGRHVESGLRRCGYRVLKNEHVTVEHRGAPLHFVGIDDPVTRRDDLDRAFAEVPGGGTRVVLCHCPEPVDELAARGADLVLAGHTHGGQINVRGITDRFFRSAGRRYYSAGFYEVGATKLYLNPGVGFSGVRVRAGRGTRAEVSLLELRGTDQ